MKIILAIWTLKVTGTRDGITACQMDIKVDGLSHEIIGRRHWNKPARDVCIFLVKWLKPLPNHVKITNHLFHVSLKMTIPREFIGAVIGPGGKIIQEMQRETGSTIVIEEVGEFGVIDIVSNNKASIDAVREKIKRIVAVPEVGEVYHGTVKTYYQLLVLLLKSFPAKMACFIFQKLNGAD